MKRQRGAAGCFGSATALIAASLSLCCRLEDDAIALRVSASIGGSASGGSANSGGAGGATTGGNSCDARAAFIATGSSDPMPRKACSSWAARRSFAQALCSCGDVSVVGALTSEGFDSSGSGGAGESGGAAVSVNGSCKQAEYMLVGGSLTIAGTLPLSPSGGFDVAGDLRLACPATTAGPIFARRDAWLLSEMSSLSLIDVARDAHLGPNGSLVSFGPVVVHGQRVQQAFDLASPCPCEESKRLDIAGIVGDGVLRNDNASIGLDVAALDVPSKATEIDLSCGRFALRRVAPGAPVTLRIHGKVALFVDAGVELGLGFAVELDESAELDWFVRGDLSLLLGARLGDTKRPSAIRLYVNGDAPIALPGTSEIAMSLYAPRSAVTVRGLGDVYGALFAGSVTAEGPLLLRYDRAVASADAGCSLGTLTSCTQCDQCAAGRSCSAGICGDCQTDGECCAPLVCNRGQCAPLTDN